MTKSWTIGLMAFALASVMSPATHATEVRNITSAEVYFSPEASGQKVLCRLIDGAQSHVRVAAFHFAETPILDALIRAHQRGIKVEVLLDKEHIEYRPKKAAPDTSLGPSPVLARLMKAGSTTPCTISSWSLTARSSRQEATTSTRRLKAKTLKTFWFFILSNSPKPTTTIGYTINRIANATDSA